MSESVSVPVLAADGKACGGRSKAGGAGGAGGAGDARLRKATEQMLGVWGELRALCNHAALCEPREVRAGQTPEPRLRPLTPGGLRSSAFSNCDTTLGWLWTLDVR